jgi:modification methylase
MRPLAGGSARVLRGDARRLCGIADRSVDLVLTSPPYPMIPQWDELFRRLGATRYSEMLEVLSGAWREARRVLVPGGLLAVVIGDALRRTDGVFRLWPNHAETIRAAADAGLVPLPYILWKKPTNKPNAFLGSGFLPPNAYVTLDCEYVLLFRNGPLKRYPVRDARRQASRFTRSERDRWFSQVWDDLRGVRQAGPGRRTGAFPPALAERLVRMFSVVGETVLDPFAGTGTTVWAAARLGRHGIGVEWDPATYVALVRRGQDAGWLSPGRARTRRPAPDR